MIVTEVAMMMVLVVAEASATEGILFCEPPKRGMLLGMSVVTVVSLSEVGCTTGMSLDMVVLAVVGELLV